ncbi:ORF411 [White spot syndrome virus]|uniref:Wsv374 n=3 Tax=White spot syndrome virus TaxID=342409 RepID=Q8VAM7_WSSVS|nr:wsv374 [Shrimp white spot syndrome virus]AFX59751.1 wsv374 [White spot syndrome virus]AAL33376.1 wsv374 [Shrimp white spot syndrome virus]AAL89301.1 WSSV433 [Shrimp white spot syndrome virus]ATU83587.1 ORF411 [White spot syndrome virus]AWQ61363.1 wsv374 [Shrimp white spot syndrome virus]
MVTSKILDSLTAKRLRVSPLLIHFWEVLSVEMLHLILLSFLLLSCLTAQELKMTNLDPWLTGQPTRMWLTHPSHLQASWRLLLARLPTPSTFTSPSRTRGDTSTPSPTPSFLV